MNVTTLQTALVIIFGFLIAYEWRVISLGFYHPLICGIITGLLVGDLKTGLYIGGSLQLMTLGITAFGGAAIPDYSTGAIVGTYLTVATGTDATVGVTIGIPVAILMVQMDIVNFTGNIFFQHKAENAIEEGNYSKVNIWQWAGNLLSMCIKGVPIMLAILLGQPVVQKVFEVVPEWVMNGLRVAGGVLPVVGIAMLLNVMPAKRQWYALVIGFVLVSYLKVPILGVALIALVWAANEFTKGKKEMAMEEKLENAQAPIVATISGSEVMGDE